MKFHLLLCDGSTSTQGHDLEHVGLHPPRFVALGARLWELRCVVERARPEDGNICAAATEARYAPIGSRDDFKIVADSVPEAPGRLP
jgi:hypothetical protein